MVDNIVKFPTKLETTVEVTDGCHDDSVDFAYTVIEELHDMMHNETGDCIFTDEDYHPLNSMMAEVVSAIYLMSQGINHPMQEIAINLLENVDITDKADYNENNEIDNEE